MERGGYVYIISNEYNTTIYIGVTTNLKNRIYEHKNKLHPNSFSAKYNCKKLVYFETLPSIEEAIEREKQLKGRSRQSKNILISQFNPEWKDLYEVDVEF